MADSEATAAQAELRAEHRESHTEAAIAVGFVMLLQLALGLVSLLEGWKLAGLPGWLWAVPVGVELGLLVALAGRVGHMPDEQTGGRRRLVLGVLVTVGFFNGLAVAALIVSLAGPDQENGRELLFEAATVWTTNVMAFGLGFWELDRGGPRRRVLPEPLPPDFQFPQMENPGLAAPGWRPRLLDYIYVSFTNAAAFSPTDVMPLSRRAKTLMLLEASVSAVTVVLVAARAVNVLN